MNLFYLIYFFTPAITANIAPVFLNIIFGKGKVINLRLFGENKTWFGFVGGIITATLVSYIIELPLLLGFLMGTGAMIGDLSKSFFKRKLQIESGKTWWFFDQTDWIIGALLFTQPILHWKPTEWILIVFVFGVSHLAVNFFGFKLGIRPYPL